MRDWLIKHPDVVGFVFAACAAFVVSCAFDAGRVVESARALSGDLDRMRSEALGG